jgi:hypothetical protein
MGKMPALRKLHAHESLPQFHERKIDCHVCLGAGVRLDVCVLCPKQLLQPVAGEVLGNIVKLAPAIVSFAGISLGILIGHNRPHRFKDGPGNKVLRCDELQPVLLPQPLLFDNICYLRICFCQIRHMQKGSLQSGNTVLFIPPHIPHSAAILSPFLLETERKAHYLK